jgi:uncharacterized pyridoxamine 5'-phosphate oxidase family protein
MAKHPPASKPYMPGYAMMFRKDRTVLPWTWASKRLSKSHNYWIATTSSDGRPHVMPVWGVWLDDKFYFSTGRRSRKSRNLDANPNCVVCPDGAAEAIIMEGVVTKMKDSISLGRFVVAYKKKYNSDIRSFERSENPIYAVNPSTIFGFVENSKTIRGNPTRWKFAR